MENRAIEPITSQIMQFIDDFPELKRRYADLPDEFAFKAKQVADHEKSIEQRLAALKTLKETFELMYLDVEKCTDTLQKSHNTQAQDQAALDRKIIGSDSSETIMPSLQDCYRTSVVETLFDMHRTTVQKYFKEKRLIGFQPNGKNRYFPRFQFEEHGPVKGLNAVLNTLGYNDENAIVFFLTPNPELNFERPIDELKAGNESNVVDAARVYKREMLTPDESQSPVFNVETGKL